jgi:hypothetical protein
MTGILYYRIVRTTDAAILRGDYNPYSIGSTFVVDFPPAGTWSYAIQAYGDGSENVLEAEIVGMVIKV